MSTFQAFQRSVSPFRPKLNIWLSWLGLTALYILLVYRQVQRPIWYDELITLFIARAPTIHDFFRLLYKWDLTPPALHVLVRISIAIFGSNKAGVRLPSILAFYSASFLLFTYAKRKLGLSYAAVPILLTLV
jgi:4-amino-4-deoxy-L-arabinose transferase-like glycosyltransferase